MIFMQTILEVADNTGAKKAMCIKVLGGSKHYCAKVGDIIKVSIRSATPKAKVKKGSVHRAVIVRTKKNINRRDGSSICFDDNAVVLLDGKNEPLGTSVSGPVSRELRGGGRYLNFPKIISLAREVL